MKNDMTQGKIFPVLMRFALPMLIGDVFQQLYNLVDTVIVGRTLGSQALAAVGSTGTIMFLMVGCTTALANSFCVVTAQRFGARDWHGVKQSFSNGIYLIILAALTVSTLCLLNVNRILNLMNTPEDILKDAAAYISVIFMGIIVTAFYNYFASSLRAIGNSKVPLYFLILSSLLNVILDLFFIVRLNLGVAGAAWATVFSQLVSALLCLIFIISKEPTLQPKGQDWSVNGKIVRQQLMIGIPIVIQNAITASGTMVMQSATNVFGSTAVAAVTASTKCRSLFTTILLAMGNAMATFVGQNYGARNWKRVKEGVYIAAGVSSVYSVIAGILAYTLLPIELRLFITDAATISELLPWARTAILLSALFFIPLGFIFIFRNAIQACGHPNIAMTAGVVELTSRIIFAYIAIHYHIFACACLCDSAAWFFAGVYTFAVFWWLTRKQ